MNNKINNWINRNALNLLRISIGIVYIWFGALKFFPKLSPADQLAKDTIDLITFGLFSSTTSILLLAIWETVLGVFLLAGIWRQSVFFMLLLHRAYAFYTLVLFRRSFVYHLTLCLYPGGTIHHEKQYYNLCRPCS
ncbi:MAG: hypothetical protein ABI663_05610 [Chryseolinea sp.]